MSRSLTAEDILSAKDLTREKCEVEEWGGHVFIRTMTGAERDQWEASMVTMTPRRVNGRIVEDAKTTLANARAKLLARVLCDEGGKLLFSAHQVDVLGQKSAAALDRCFDVAKRLNHLTSDDVEELVKNSEGGQSAGSGSA